jgi:hypothetical protein
MSRGIDLASGVMPKEGIQLTRIEMRINRLLERQETTDLMSHRPKPAPQRAASTAATAESPILEPPPVEPSEPAPAAPEPRRPVYGRHHHRYRRSL